MEGGYQIIDFKNRKITSTPDGNKGIFELISKTKKPLLIQNLVVVRSGSDVTLRDFFASVADIGNDSYLVTDLAQSVSLLVTADTGVMDTELSPVSASMIPINSTLEVDANGLLGVKAGS